MRILLPFVVAIVATPLTSAGAQRGPLSGFDNYITTAMRDWKVPGLAVAIVRNDTIVHMRGYGTRTMNANDPVDEHTIFAVGSTSKAFTATLVGMLVDEGKLRWDDAAHLYLPGLELFDPYVSKELSVRDLLSHRSGLARGDLIWYATDYDRRDVLRRVRFLKPAWSVRARFGYQNIMYLAAGEIASTISGRSWDDLVRDRIFTPLGMSETNTSTRALAPMGNVATPHAEIDDTLRVVDWHNIDNIGPAGSINSSAADMIKWVRMQLNGGKVGSRSIVSAGILTETHSPQIVVPMSADVKQLNPYSHLMSYGLGWFLQDYRGRELRQHGGNIDGMSAMVAMVPEERIGLVVLTNANGSPMPAIAMYRAIDALIGAAPRDWSGEYRKLVTKQRALGKETESKRLAQRATGTAPSLSLEKYVGAYADSLYGDATVRSENGRLRLAYGTYFDGELEHWHHDTFRAIWKDRMLGKSFVTFALDADGKVKSADVEGWTTFGRRPDAPDTTTRVVLAATEATKLTGTFVSQTPALTIEVTYTDGALRLTVPGQPVYTLLADSPTRFRMTGPPNMPAGFFLEYRFEGGAVKELVLTQPTPRPTLTFAPRK